MKLVSTNPPYSFYWENEATSAVHNEYREIFANPTHAGQLFTDNQNFYMANDIESVDALIELATDFDVVNGEYKMLKDPDTGLPHALLLNIIVQ